MKKKVKTKKPTKKQKEAEEYWKRMLARAEAENRAIRNNMDQFGVWKGFRG